MKTKIGFIIVVFIIAGLVSEMGWTMGQQAASGQDKALRLTQMVKNIHVEYLNLIRTNTPDALVRQKNFLLKQTDVKEVKQLRGSNLLVTFKDGEKLLMFLGKDSLGSSEGSPGNSPQVVQQRAQVKKVEMAKIHPEALKRLLLVSCAPDSPKALIFDCLEDDANVVSPKAWQQVKSDLEALGYTVITQLNNAANLSNASLIDDGEYGIVMMRGHGGDMGGDFGFLVRPWYDSWPPANSGYTGTIRASAYNHAINDTQFGYVITGQFSSAYWTNRAFPQTLFFLESCHGADPGALPGMPQWTIDHGAIAWLGWNDSVSFGCGDNGTVLFFERMKNADNVGEALKAVFDTGCRPPELVSFPTNKGGCRLSVWKSDPNEAAVADAQDYKMVKLIAGPSLQAKISFYAVPNFSSFYFYVDTGGTDAAEVCVRCYPDKYEVNKQTQPGLYNDLVFTGTPAKSGNDYTITVPWTKSFGSVDTVRAWIYNMGVKDRLPDSGSVVLQQ